ncbi:protein PFC0760c-like [Cotesia glomerata]|nr:protein PFC0760c-like [Cotesia glomerata]
MDQASEKNTSISISTGEQNTVPAEKFAKHKSDEHSAVSCDLRGSSNKDSREEMKQEDDDVKPSSARDEVDTSKQKNDSVEKEGSNNDDKNQEEKYDVDEEHGVGLYCDEEDNPFEDVYEELDSDRDDDYY